MIAVVVDGTGKTSTEEATRATGGHTSGESAPRGFGQWHGTKADTPEASALSQGAKRGGARPGRGVGTSVERRR
jgi:hypothetical protein